MARSDDGRLTVARLENRRAQLSCRDKAADAHRYDG